MVARLNTKACSSSGCGILLCAFLAAGTAGGFCPLPPLLSSSRSQGSLFLAALPDTLEKIAASSTSSSSGIDIEALEEWSNCKSGTAARKVLEKALLTSDTGTDTTNDRGTAAVRLPLHPAGSLRPIPIGRRPCHSNQHPQRQVFGHGTDRTERWSRCRSCVARPPLRHRRIDLLGPRCQSEPTRTGHSTLRRGVAIKSFAPLFFVGTSAGIAAPAELQTVLVGIQRNLFPTYRRRMIQHEAGHFLLGHLLGLPIKGYRANAVKNAVEFYPLSDDEVGMDTAKLLGFDSATSRNNDDASGYESSSGGGGSSQPYFSEGGRGQREMQQQSVFREKKDYANNPFLKLPAQNEPKNSWPYRRLRKREMNVIGRFIVAPMNAAPKGRMSAHSGAS